VAFEMATDRRFPRFLPDGRQYLYYGTGAEPGIYIGQLGSTDSQLVVTAHAAVYADKGHLLFVHQGTLFSQRFDVAGRQLTGERTTVAQQIATSNKPGLAPLSISTDGTIVYRSGGPHLERQLVWFDRSGALVERVPNSSWNEGVTFQLSRDERRVAFDEAVRGQTDVGILDLQNGTRSRFTTDDSLFELQPIWSGNDDHMVYTAGPTGPEFDIYVRSTVDTASPPRRIPMPGNQSVADVSRDGAYVLYGQPLGRDASDIMALPLAGEQKPFVVVRSGFVNGNAQFSPDGQWVAYQSNQPGTVEIFVQGFRKSNPTQVSFGGGVQPRWGPGGKELYFLAPDNTLMVVPVALDAAANTIDGGTPRELFRKPLSGSPQARSNRQYVVASDGRRFLFDIAIEITVPIQVISHWRPE
jgi:Tol biopolymer transport system component